MCKETKPADLKNFKKEPNAKCGLKSQCRICMSKIEQVRWANKNE